MVSEISLDNASLAAAIHTLARAAYTLEAAQIGCADFPPLRESLEQLRASVDRFLVFRENEKVVGVLSFVGEEDCANITRLFVSPTHFRQGIARILIGELEQRLQAGASVTVSTAEANLPAVMLYQKCRYAIAGSSRSPEGIALFHFEKLRLHYSDR
jgi:ribosomal protein S18 acetylase RimI-like enzyme